MSSITLHAMQFVGALLGAYTVLLGFWLVWHALRSKGTVEVPQADLLESEDAAEQENVCSVTGERHRWKCQGEDRRGTFYSQCQDCGEVSES